MNRQIDFPAPKNEVKFLTQEEAGIVIKKALKTDKSTRYTKKRLMGLLRKTTLNRHRRNHPEDLDYTLLYIRDVEAMKAQDAHNANVILELNRAGLFEYKEEKVTYVRGRKSYPFYVAKLKQ